VTDPLGKRRSPSAIEPSWTDDEPRREPPPRPAPVDWDEIGFKLRAAVSRPAAVARSPSRGALAEWAAALRLHQWSKNLVILVPFALNQEFASAAAALRVVIAFLAFCLVASAGYIVNDLKDRAADRAHPTKRFRPFASGRLNAPAGLAVAA